MSLRRLAAALSAAAGLLLIHRAFRARRREADLRCLAYAQAQAADERRRFLRRLDHELKNPLTAMQVGLANLAETDDPTSRRQIHASIQAQIQRLSDLVGQLRKLAELEAGSLECLPFDIAAMLREVMAAAQEHTEAARRRLVLTLPLRPLPPGVGDQDLLQLAVYNLVDNAIKFTRPGDTVELRAFANETTATIEVEDTGPGISPVDLPHVWEELYRGREAHAVPGSGIGLAMVKVIVERHGGKVRVQSEVGKGTTVTLRLPVNVRRP